MPIDKKFQSIFQKNIEINFLQCSPEGYLKYTDLCQLLQLIANEHAKLGGLSFHDLQVVQQAWVLQKLKINIASLPKWGDLVLLKTYVAKMDSETSTRAIEMFLNEKLIVSATSYWSVMNTQKRKSSSLDLPYKHFLNHNINPEEKATNDYSNDIEICSEQIKNYTVLLSDLDFLNHVNNVKYLEWCLDFFHSGDFKSKPIKKIEMFYFRELKEGDNIIIYQKNGNNRSFFDLSRSGKKCFKLDIVF